DHLKEMRFNVPIEATAFAKPAEGAADFGFASGASALGIPFELNSNHIYLQARVNGSAPLWFLFDSGAGSSLVDLKRAKELGLKLKGSFQARGAGEGSLE